MGDMSICPLCDAVLVFVEGLMLRLASISEQVDAQIEPTKSKA